MSLRFNNISHAYGDAPVLSDLTFAVNAGEITCLLGPSGGGKSTLLRLAAGLEPVQSGSIEIGGEVVASPGVTVPPERRPVGLMFQEHALFPHMTVDENVGFGLAKWPKAKRRARVEALLQMVGLADLAKRFPHQLSGGQQQRIALVRSLAPEPTVLLMDEPYASIDITLRRALREAARLTLKRDGTTTIMVTHDPSEAMEMADVIAVLDGGCILQVGTPHTLYESPVSPSVAALFGDAQRLTARRSSSGFDTDFGPIVDDPNAPSVPEGQGPADADCEVVVRPAGLRLSHDPDASATITDIRYVGDGWLAFLSPGLASANGATEASAPLRVTIDAPDAWKIADRVALKRADRGFYVFPRASA